MSERETSKLRTQVQNCPVSYVESVGKIDKEALGRAVLEGDGKGTVVRLIMGATQDSLPFRAVSYAASAIRIAQHIPCEQIQIIHAVRLGEQVNGINRVMAEHHAQKLEFLIFRRFGELVADSKVPIVHGFDTPIDLAKHRAIAEKAFEANTGVFSKLRLTGQKHGGDPITYTAAHRAFQDTDSLEVLPLLPCEHIQVPAKRIISVGASSERQFYAARMAMQAIEPPEIETAQIFTRHLTPPYFEARGGEQSVNDVLMHGIDINKTHDPAARRDITHFLGTLSKGEMI